VKRPGQIALLITSLVVIGAGTAAARHTSVGPVPVRVEDAGLTGDVWVMPEKDVLGFLNKRGVTQTNANPYPSGTAVVGRVSWSPLKGGDQDYFTVLLGDLSGGAGEIDTVVGLPDGEVSLGSGSMWNKTIKAHDWLRGSRTITLNSNGVTSFGTFASVPTSWAGDVWFVAHVVDVSGIHDIGTPPERVDQPSPVVGVALTTGDHVWWVKKVASA